VAEIEDLQRRIDDILSGGGKGNEFIGDVSAAEAAPEQWYSPFSVSHQQRAIELTTRLMQIADEKGGEEGLADAVSEIERARDTTEMPRLVQHATKLFLMHHPEARAKLRLKPLEQRQPDLVRPSRPRSDTDPTAPPREQGT
jgi:hypothetical protein